MTPQEIALVQSSGQPVRPIRATAADLFHARLFRGALHAQGATPMSTLDAVASGPDLAGTRLPTAEALADAMEQAAHGAHALAAAPAASPAA